MSSQGRRHPDDPRRLLSRSSARFHRKRELMFPELKNETLKASITVLVGAAVGDHMNELNRQSFPTTLRGSECYCCLVIHSCPTLCDPMDCSPPGPSVHWNSPGKNTGVGCHALPPGDPPDLGIKPWSPAMAGGFFMTKAPGKPRVINTNKMQKNILVEERLRSPSPFN